VKTLTGGWHCWQFSWANFEKEKESEASFTTKNSREVSSRARVWAGGERLGSFLEGGVEEQGRKGMKKQKKEDAILMRTESYKSQRRRRRQSRTERGEEGKNVRNERGCGVCKTLESFNDMPGHGKKTEGEERVRRWISVHPKNYPEENQERRRKEGVLRGKKRESLLLNKTGTQLEKNKGEIAKSGGTLRVAIAGTTKRKKIGQEKVKG